LQWTSEIRCEVRLPELLLKHFPRKKEPIFTLTQKTIPTNPALESLPELSLLFLAIPSVTVRMGLLCAISLILGVSSTHRMLDCCQCAITISHFSIVAESCLG